MNSLIGVIYNNELIPLSGKYALELDKRKINIKENAYLNNFYGKRIESITAICGENGTGKTKFINTIFNKISINRGEIICIYEKISKKGEIKFIQSKKNTRYTFIFNGVQQDEHLITEKLDFSVIKYSASLETKVETIEGKGVDVSNSFMLKNIPFHNIFKEDMFKQVSFVLNNIKWLEEKKEIINIEGVNVRTAITDHGIAANEYFLRFFKHLNIKKSSINFESINNKVEKNKNNIHYILLLKMLIIAISNIEDYENKLNSEKFSNISTYEKLLEEIIKLSEEKEERDALRKCLNQLNKLLENLNEVHNINYYDNSEMKEIINDSKTNKYIEELYSVFQFEWEGLSSGEFNLLNMFARIDSELERITSDNIIILLDEIDVGFHPEWQRCIVMLISEYIEKKKHLDNKRVKVILTTHSPIPLSDVLREDTLIFKKNSKKVSEERTFGQNIHTIFKETFLLNNTIGSFSNNVIDDLLYTLSLNYLTPLENKDKILKANYNDEKKQVQDYEEAIKDLYLVNKEYFDENDEEIPLLLEIRIDDINKIKLVEETFSKSINSEDIFMFNISKKFPFIREKYIYKDLKVLIDSIGERVYKNILLNLLKNCCTRFQIIEEYDIEEQIQVTKNEIREYETKLEQLEKALEKRK